MNRIYNTLPSHHEYLTTGIMSPAAKINMLSAFLSSGMMTPGQLTKLLNYTDMSHNDTLKTQVETYA
jgi:hypothetical protein